MTRIVKKEQVGKFGKIVAGEKGYKKTFYGTVFYVDALGGVVFIDNDDIAHRFQQNLIDTFDEEEFKDKSK